MASPLGFSEAGRHFYGAVLVPFVAGLGYEVLDPWALADQAKIEAVQRLPYGPEKRDAWRTLNREIGAINRAAIDRAPAQEFVPAIVFDMGGKFDKSFNEAAYTGAERF